MTRPWYPFYWSDYSGKTFSLTQGQHGAYILLLRYLYTEGGPIPPLEVYSIAKATLEQERQNVDYILNKYFLDKGGWVHEKVNEIMSEAEERHKKLVESGSKGGKARSSHHKASLKHNTTTTTTTLYNNKQPDKPSGLGLGNPTITHSADSQNNTEQNNTEQNNKNPIARGYEKHSRPYTKDEVLNAKAGEPGYNPNLIDCEVLPGGWYEEAEKLGLRDGVIYEKFRYIKKRDAPPYSRKNWISLINFNGVKHG